jgi:hypothetical protein
MADNNQYKRAEHTDFLDNDPFAELTRIMGQDPRPVAVQPQDPDLGMDLERELLGDFDFDPAQDDAPEAVDFVAEAPRQDYGRAEPEMDFAPEPLASAPVAREARPEPDFSEPQLAAPAAPADDVLDHDFMSGLEDEMARAVSLDDGFTQPDIRADEGLPVEADAPAAYDEAQWGAARPHWDEPVGTSDAQAWAPDEPAVYDEPASYDEPATYDEHAGYAEPVRASAEDASDELEADLAAVDMDFDALEDDLAAIAAAASHVDYHAAELAEPVSLPGAAHVEEAPEASMDDWRVSAADADHDDDPGAQSLEDELQAMLADDVVEPAPQQDWRPSVATFGSAAAAGFAAQAQEPQPAAEPEIDDDLSAFLDEEFRSEVDVHAADDRGEAQSDDPWGGSPLLPPATQPVWGKRSPSEVEAPSVETVDVGEASVPTGEDFAVPELHYADEPAPTRPLDDIEAEFEDAFAQGYEPPAEPLVANVAAADAAANDPWSDDRAYALQPETADERFGTEAEEGYSEDEWQAELAREFDAGNVGNYATEAQFEQDMVAEDYDVVAPPPAPRRRGFVLAGAVAAVALLGGAGVFAMSMMGGGSGEPVLIQADADPMKVRPENPGGTVVPNQESEAYQRVAGGASDTAPEQESLITSVEEPVDIAASEEILPPGVSAIEEGTWVGIDDDMAAVADEDPLAEIAKSEERMAAETEVASLSDSDDFVAVAPRRVRTMIVRPDGTMVPREETVAAEPLIQDESTATASVALAPAAQDALTVATAAGELPAVAQPVEDEGPTVDTPPSVAVVPSAPAPRPQQQETTQVAAAAAPAPVAPAAPQPSAPAAEVTPASAPAAAAPSGAASSEWSMQIASQPSAESAQATYQDLARRYGGILEGRGVNIVRADIEGKGVYYRVRIPAASRDEAIQLCTRYKSSGGSCFVSR